MSLSVARPRPLSTSLRTLAPVFRPPDRWPWIRRPLEVLASPVTSGLRVINHKPLVKAHKPVTNPDCCCGGACRDRVGDQLLVVITGVLWCGITDIPFSGVNGVYTAVWSGDANEWQVVIGFEVESGTYPITLHINCAGIDLETESWNVLATAETGAPIGTYFYFETAFLGPAFGTAVNSVLECGDPNAVGASGTITVSIPPPPPGP